MTTLLELTKKLHNTLALYNGAGHALGWKTEKVDKLLDESKRVIELAEQSAQQEPVAWLVCENWRKHSLFFTEEGAEDFKNAAQREDDLSGNLARWKAKPLYTSSPAQPAQQLPFGVGGGLVAIKTLLSRDPCAHAKVAIEMIDAMLSEQPAQQQEPVAWIFKRNKELLWPDEIEVKDPSKHRGYKPLYTSPPASKPWVGLTDEEINKTFETKVWDARRSYARAIEAKLREKNGGTND